MCFDLANEGLWFLLDSLTAAIDKKEKSGVIWEGFLEEVKRDGFNGACELVRGRTKGEGKSRHVQKAVGLTEPSAGNRDNNSAWPETRVGRGGR